MNTIPGSIGVNHTGATRATLQSQGPPGAQHGVEMPQDTVGQGFAAPPVTYVPPAAATEEPKRKGPSRLMLGLLGVAAGVAITIGMLGPGNTAAGVHQAAQPAAHVTVKDTSKTSLKSEAQKAQYGIAVESSQVDTTLSASGNFGASRDFVQLQPDSSKYEANGYTFTYNGARLIARGGEQDQTVYDAREGLMPDYVQSFNQEGEENWSIRTTVRPAGGVATLASIAVTSNVYTGGSPNQTAELMTFDHVEGKRVLLTDLLSPQQQAHVLSSVRSGLAAVPAGTLFQHDNLGDIVNRSFSIHEDGGKLRLTVAVPGNNEANEGRVAQFTFSVPRDILK